MEKDLKETVIQWPEAPGVPVTIYSSARRVLLALAAEGLPPAHVRYSHGRPAAWEWEIEKGPTARKAIMAAIPNWKPRKTRKNSDKFEQLTIIPDNGTQIEAQNGPENGQVGI